MIDTTITNYASNKNNLTEFWTGGGFDYIAREFKAYDIEAIIVDNDSNGDGSGSPDDINAPAKIVIFDKVGEENNWEIVLKEIEFDTCQKAIDMLSADNFLKDFDIEIKENTAKKVSVRFTLTLLHDMDINVFNNVDIDEDLIMENYIEIMGRADMCDYEVSDSLSIHDFSVEPIKSNIDLNRLNELTIKDYSDNNNGDILNPYIMQFIINNNITSSNDLDNNFAIFKARFNADEYTSLQKAFNIINPILTKMERLQSEYDLFLTDNNLPPMSADELSYTDKVNSWQKSYLEDFVLRWQIAEDTE